MTKKTLLLSSLFPVSILVLVTAIMLACIDVDISPYPDSFFPPEISHSPRDVDFFVSNNSLYGPQIFKTSYTEDFHTNNIAEWNLYFKNKVNNKDLESIIYTCSLGEIDTLIFSVKKPGYPISNFLKSNSIFGVTDTRSALDFLYYIGFAKRCEKYSTYNPTDWWDDAKVKADDPRNDKASMATQITGGIKQIGNANSDFVKQRYAFQVVRLYFQMKNYDSCISFYNNHAVLLNKVENTIRYRAMGYLAGAYMAKGQVAEADFTYSLVFDRCNEMRDAAYFSFKPQEEADFTQSLALATTNRQKEALWQILGLSKDPLRAMKEIYKLDPKSDMLDLLLMRAVNKAEEKFLNQSMASMEIDDPNMSDITKDSIHANLAFFIKQVAGAGNTAKPYEWNLAAGYLDWVMGGTDFEKYFSGVNAEATNDKLVSEELRLFHLLDKLKNGKAGDKDFENNILPDLKWLKDTNHAPNFRRDFAWAFVSDFMAKKYNDIGNIPIGNCFTLNLIDHLTNGFNASSYISDTLINTMEGFIDKKDKSPFEEFAVAQLPLYKPDFIDLEAIHLMYNYDFKGALAQLNSNNAPGPENVYGDPFIIHITDNHDSDAVLPNKSVHTKKEFLERMIELQKKADNNTKNADDYFMLANGYYNMSYFGNNRVFFTSKLSSMESYSPDYKDWSKDEPVYENCGKALEYYQKAMDASKDPEFKAKCCFMCAKCEQNYFFTHKPDNYKGDFKAGKYFVQLKANYASTQYYNEVIKECGYFRTYTNH